MSRNATTINLNTLLDEWRDAQNVNDAVWFIRWANAAIDAGLPCYPDGRTNMGASGWALWLADALSALRLSTSSPVAPRKPISLDRGRERIKAWMNYVNSSLAAVG